MTTQDQADLKEANLQDVRAGSLTTHIPNARALDTPNFLVEYGVRVDDQAMVFHFYSPAKAERWDTKYRMNDRLKAAIDKHLDPTKLSCGYTLEMDSFYVIIGGMGSSPDPWPLCERFIASIDDPL